MIIPTLIIIPAAEECATPTSTAARRQGHTGFRVQGLRKFRVYMVYDLGLHGLQGLEGGGGGEFHRPGGPGCRVWVSQEFYLLPAPCTLVLGSRVQGSGVRGPPRRIIVGCAL